MVEALLALLRRDDVPVLVEDGEAVALLQDPQRRRRPLLVRDDVEVLVADDVLHGRASSVTPPRSNPRVR